MLLKAIANYDKYMKRQIAHICTSVDQNVFRVTHHTLQVVPGNFRLATQRILANILSANQHH